MPLSQRPDFKAIEAKWSRHWEEHGTYRYDEKSGKQVYSIDSPPPFTSGALHMGHMLSYSYFDFAARFKRMKGCNVFFPQGWDCQGFPTEIKVEKKFGRLPREEFLKKCIAFTEENIASMKRQMAAMGFSPDWRFEYRTMDDDYHRRVQYSLLKMFDAGLVYRAKHPVLFCTSCRSAIAKAEVEELERETTLNTVAFSTEDDQELRIATTRPELLHVCVAVLVNPTDEKNRHFAGKTAVVPVFGRKVPILADNDVDKEFGTGAVMVCSYGDKTDVQWIYRHKLPVVEAMGEDGKVMNAGPGFDGLSAMAMHERVVEELKAQGRLLKQEPLKQTVKTHDRCGKPVEFLGSMQWFIKLKGFEDKISAAGKSMRWIPDFSVQYLVDWAEFIDYDWVISRQRVYGTLLPFYNCAKCGKGHPAAYSKLPVDPTRDRTAGKCECGGELVGESSTCDVWIDSSITPLVIGGWPDEDKKGLLAKVYPASLRPQGLEIIRTWAFYTIARCLALTGEAPFKEVLINGNVLGTDGKKMSKSVGNYEDPDLLLKRYPADALRQWAALSGAFARDRPFSYKDVEFSQAFLVKLWNASKFVEKATVDYDHSKAGASKLEFRATDKWLLSRLHSTVKASNGALKEYDYYTAINAIHDFFRHDFCDYYLEEVKYRIYGNKPSKQAAQYCLYSALNAALKLLAPFAPFTTEEIHSELFAKAEGVKSIHLAEYPLPDEEYINSSGENIVVVLHQLLSEARKFKASNGLPLNEELSYAAVTLPEAMLDFFGSFEEELRSVAGIQKVEVRTGDSIAVELRK